MASSEGKGPCDTSLPTLFFCGDPHGGFDQINEAARLYRPDAMILLGDMQTPDPLERVLEEALHYTKIWWIPGNHDTDCEEYYDSLWHGGLSRMNLHGRVAQVAGLRIAGLGGVFRGQIWMPDAPPNYISPSSFMRRIGRKCAWRGAVPLRHRSTIFPSVYEKLIVQQADILVTHEAPGCHARGFACLQTLATKMGCRWYFHGHQHEDRLYEDQENGLRVRGVGFQGIVDLHGEVVIPAKLDPREEADIEHMLDAYSRPCQDKAIILVRDAQGMVQVLPSDAPLPEGMSLAIHPCCPDHHRRLKERVKGRDRKPKGVFVPSKRRKHDDPTRREFSIKKKTPARQGHGLKRQ